MLKLILDRSVEDLASLLECDERAVVTVKVWLVELLEVRTVTVGQKTDRRGKDKGTDKAVVTVSWLQTNPSMCVRPGKCLANSNTPNVLAIW